MTNIFPWIQNISIEAIILGRHFDAGENSMLIQIGDPNQSLPIPKFDKFKHVHQFFFYDIALPEYEGSITDDDAMKIAELIKAAFSNRTNIVVHCHAGLCRSGAIASAAIKYGFSDTGVDRMPNVLVKEKILKYLKIDYPESEKREDMLSIPKWEE